MSFVSSNPIELGLLPRLHLIHIFFISCPNKDMMEIPWHNLFSDMEMEMEGEGELLKEQRYNKVNSFDQEDDEELDLGDILQLHYSANNNFSFDSTETLSPSAIGATSSSTLSFDDTTGAAGGGFNNDDDTNNNKRCKILSKSSSSNSIASQLVPPPPLAAETNSSSSPKSCIILSFDDSSGSREGGGGGRKKQQQGGGGSSSSRGLRCSTNSCNQKKELSAAKKTRNSSESLDHIMAERKRRQELTERFIALSATIPGLKKIDKASILSEAINYVKQLQERVKTLENESSNKVKVESFMMSRGTEEGTDGSSKITNSSGSSSDHEYYCHRPKLNNSNIVDWLPEVEARALENQVLLRIHCHNHSGVMLNILAHLKALHLSVISSSVLPFGNSALDITIIAQMGEKYKGTVKELVKSMRMSLLVESPDDIQQRNRDP